MDIETLRSFLAWCTVINWVFLFFWWWMFAMIGDWVYGLHSRWFDVPRETFDGIHYAGMAGFKILTFVFNLTPYLVLRFFF